MVIMFKEKLQHSFKDWLILTCKIFKHTAEHNIIFSIKYSTQSALELLPLSCHRQINFHICLVYWADQLRLQDPVINRTFADTANRNVFGGRVFHRHWTPSENKHILDTETGYYKCT